MVMSLEIICGKCSRLMPNDQNEVTGWVTFKCTECGNVVQSPNLYNFKRKEND